MGQESELSQNMGFVRLVLFNRFADGWYDVNIIETIIMTRNGENDSLEQLET